MGRKRVLGLEWLDPQDRNQREWALNYLWAKDRLPDNKRPTDFIKDADIQKIGAAMERTANGRGVLKLMKEAWRQKRNKDTNIDTETCTFNLKASTKASLRELAEHQKKNMTSLLEALIGKAYKSHQSRIKKEKAPQSKPEKTASNTFARGQQPSTGTGNIDTAQSSAYPEESIQSNHRTSLAPSESVSPVASNSIGQPTAEPTESALPPDFVMIGLIPDTPPPKEIDPAYHQAKMVFKAMLAGTIPQGAPTTTTEAPLPDSSHEIVMPGQDPDLPTTEEIAHFRHQMSIAAKDKLARKNAHTEASKPRTAQAGTPEKDPRDPSPEPDPDLNEPEST